MQVKLSQFRLERPRQWGACWTFVKLWEQLRLDEFWRERLSDSREGTSRYHVLQLKAHAPGLTVRQGLQELERMQLLDVRFPTTDARELLFNRYTEPKADQQLLLAKLGWDLPPQASPKIAPLRISATM